MLLAPAHIALRDVQASLAHCARLSRHPALPAPCPLLQTFLLWLCTFHTNLVTSWLFLSLSLLFWFLAGGVGTSSERVTLTKFAGGWGFMVAATAFYDGTAALMKVRLRGQGLKMHAAAAATWPLCYACSSSAPTPGGRLFIVGSPISWFLAAEQDVYGRQILPVFPLKPVNKVSLGDFGTKRFVDPEAPAKA